MRNFQLLIFFSLLSLVAFAQVGPGTTIKLTQLEKSKTEEGTKAGQVGLTNSNGQQRYAQYVEANLTPIAFVPTPTGNTTNFSEFVTDPAGEIWYIDWKGEAVKVKSASAGGGDADWYATPSYTPPSAITQHAWRAAAATIGGRYEPTGSPELTLVDSTAFDASGGGRAGLYLEGTTKNTIGMKQASNGKWNAIDGSAGNMYFYTDSTSKGIFIFMEGYNQPNLPVSHTPHFSINTTTRQITANFYPNTLNSSGNPVNVLSTSSAGVLESHPVSEVVAAGGGITGNMANGQILYATGQQTIAGSEMFKYTNGNTITIGNPPNEAYLKMWGPITFQHPASNYYHTVLPGFPGNYDGSLLFYSMGTLAALINNNLDFYMYGSLAALGQTTGIGSTGQVGTRLHVRGATTDATAFAARFQDNSSLDILTLRNDKRIGVNTASPAQTLHVQGTARITDSDATPTTITGRDADGDIGNVTIGSGLSLSGGSLSTTSATIPAGTSTNNTLRWNGTAWVETSGILSDDTSLETAGNATVGGTVQGITNLALKANSGASQTVTLYTDYMKLPAPSSNPTSPVEAGIWYNNTNDDLNLKTSSTVRTIPTQEMIGGSFVAFPIGTGLTVGNSTDGFCVPLGWNGRAVKDIVFTVTGGTGDATVRLRRLRAGAYSNTTDVNFTASGVQTITGTALNIQTGDILLAEVTAEATDGLTGLFVGFNLQL